MQQQAVGVDACQGAFAEQSHGVGHGQRVGGDGGQWFGEQVGVVGDEGEGYGLGGEPGQQGEQLQRGGIARSSVALLADHTRTRSEEERCPGT